MSQCYIRLSGLYSTTECHVSKVQQPRQPAGDVRQGEGGVAHFGLALSEYTHFTSPIRRYADVVVHRQLLKALALHPADSTHVGSEPPTQASAAESAAARNIMTHSELVEAADIMNERHRAAKRAQKECSDLYLLLLLHRLVTSMCLSNLPVWLILLHAH